MRRSPVELALGLGVRSATELVHHHQARLAGEQPTDEPRHAHRLLRSQLPGEGWQPLGDGRRVVVDDVAGSYRTPAGRS
jgi:hypothetical protein